jgi:hypothetical protein
MSGIITAIRLPLLMPWIGSSQDQRCWLYSMHINMLRDFLRKVPVSESYGLIRQSSLSFLPLLQRMAMAHFLPQAVIVVKP